MPNTFDLIATQSFSGVSTASISVPATFTDIQIRASVRSNRSADSSNLYFYVNGDTSSGSYGRATLYNENGSNGGEIQPIGVTSSTPQMGAQPAANMSSNLFTNICIDIPNYAGSIKKTYQIYTSVQRQGGALRYIWRNLGIWNSTSPITSIAIFDPLSTFGSGTQVSVYGIKKV
jgi:hypothetical protein